MNGHWFWWTLIALMMLERVLVIASIGKAREPVEAKDAAIGTVITALTIWGIAFYGFAR